MAMKLDVGPNPEDLRNIGELLRAHSVRVTTIDRVPGSDPGWATCVSVKLDIGSTSLIVRGDVIALSKTLDVQKLAFDRTPPSAIPEIPDSRSGRFEVELSNHGGRAKAYLAFDQIEYPHSPGLWPDGEISVRYFDGIVVELDDRLVCVRCGAGAGLVSLASDQTIAQNYLSHRSDVHLLVV